MLHYQTSSTLQIESTLLENNASASDIVLLGDFNFPHIKWDNGHASNNATAHGRLLLAITELFYLEQIVDKPTRVNNILDLVFCPHTVSNSWNILPQYYNHNYVTHCHTINVLMCWRHWTITKQTGVNLMITV